MAVIQISRITHRTGLKEDLPQLAKAELGWAIDTRELYIGNGLPEQGAPIAGNTAILTEYSDIFGLLKSYTFKGLAAGYQVVNPTVRTLQDKLDDIVNVRDFGASGDGITDDTAAFKRAILQIYDPIENPVQPLVRREIIVPAGTYHIVADQLVVPPWVTFCGEGKDKTIIRQGANVYDCLFTTGDILLQSGLSIGTGTSYMPTMVEFKDMTLSNTSSKPVFIIDSATSCSFVNVKFQGSKVDPIVIDTDTAAVVIKSSVTNSENIIFDRCDFTNASVGITSDDDVNGVIINQCTFDQLYNGVKLGENSTTSFPSNWKITNSVFRTISNEAIYCYDGVSNIVSTVNTYKDVGNQYQGIGNEVSNAIKFVDDYNYSIADTFERSTTNESVYKNVSYGTTSSLMIDAVYGSTIGMSRHGIGRQVTLVNNMAFPDLTGISISGTINGVIVDYNITRGNNSRNGYLLINQTASTATVEDNFSETADVGIVFSVSKGTGKTDVLYTSTNNGSNATLKYTIRSFL